MGIDVHGISPYVFRIGERRKGTRPTVHAWRPCFRTRKRWKRSFNRSDEGAGSPNALPPFGSLWKARVLRGILTLHKACIPSPHNMQQMASHIKDGPFLNLPP